MLDHVIDDCSYSKCVLSALILTPHIYWPVSNSVGGESPPCYSCLLLDSGALPDVGSGTRDTTAIDQSPGLCPCQQCIGSQ
jgi:hypothetical protein